LGEKEKKKKKKEQVPERSLSRCGAEIGEEKKKKKHRRHYSSDEQQRRSCTEPELGEKIRWLDSISLTWQDLKVRKCVSGI
jgi:hypothetical protein